MNDFEYALPVVYLVEFIESLNESLNFKKFDVTLDSLNLKPSIENNRLVDKIKDELSSFLMDN